MNKTPTVPILEARGICRHIGKHEILRDVSLEVRSGETICIVGPSGSGKSTFLRCLNWLDEPQAGEVLLRGQPLGRKPGPDGSMIAMSEKELSFLRTRIAVVFQNFNLWPHLTVLGNVIEAPVHVLRKNRQEATERGRGLLEKVGLGALCDRYPNQLSGGQRQRVAIARALAMEPDVVLFDEPTSSLDPELVGEVLEVMRDLANEGLTMVVVTHELAFGREAATEMVFFDQGRIEDRGPPDRFFSAPSSKRLAAFLTRYNREGIG